MPSCKINSVVPDISEVISVSSLKSSANDIAPDMPPPDKPTPALISVISPDDENTPVELL